MSQLHCWCAIVCAFQFQTIRRRKKKTTNYTNTPKYTHRCAQHKFDTRNDVEHFLVEFQFIIYNILLPFYFYILYFGSGNFGWMCKILLLFIFISFILNVFCDHCFISIQTHFIRPFRRVWSEISKLCKSNYIQHLQLCICVYVRAYLIVRCFLNFAYKSFSVQIVTLARSLDQLR